MEDEDPEDQIGGDEPTEEGDEDYDLENGVPVFFRYNLPSGDTFIVTRRFTNLSVIGHGSYGIVCSAFDNKLKKQVAIKRNKVIENFVYCKRLLRELVILRVLDHPNIVRLHHIQRIVDQNNFSAIYLVTDLMETDLDQVIKSDQKLTNEHIQYFMYQVLVGMKYIHSADLIHRDLKPSNILINSNCDIKICDFGLSVSESQHMTNYVVSRWYRAPELVIGDRKYNKSIDMWSIGCIFAELILRRTLFPGKSPFDQFICFMKILGSPNPNCFRTGIPTYLKEQIRKKEMDLNGGFPFPARSFEVIFRNQTTPEAIDLLKNLIMYDSRKRFSVEQALSHPYFGDLHDSRDEPLAGFRIQFEEYEKKLTNHREVKFLIYKQSLIFNNPDLRRRFVNQSQNEDVSSEKDNMDDEDEEEGEDEEEEEEEVEVERRGRGRRRRRSFRQRTDSDDDLGLPVGVSDLENELRGNLHNHGGINMNSNNNMINMNSFPPGQGFQDNMNHHHENNLGVRNNIHDEDEDDDDEEEVRSGNNNNDNNNILMEDED